MSWDIHKHINKVMHSDDPIKQLKKSEQLELRVVWLREGVPK